MRAPIPVFVGYKNCAAQDAISPMRANRVEGKTITGGGALAGVGDRMICTVERDATVAARPMPAPP